MVRKCHHARLSYPGGPDYHRVIVDYRADGATITVELPITEASSADLDHRQVGLEILDDCLSVTAAHVQLTGRAETATPPAEPAASTAPPWAPPRRPRPTIVLRQVSVDRDEP